MNLKISQKLTFRGDDGYEININELEPETSNPVHKMVSAMAYYSYRLMVRPKENHLLNYRQLLHQYFVDMYAKIDTETTMLKCSRSTC